MIPAVFLLGFFMSAIFAPPTLKARRAGIYEALAQLV